MSLIIHRCTKPGSRFTGFVKPLQMCGCDACKELYAEVSRVG